MKLRIILIFLGFTILNACGESKKEPNLKTENIENVPQRTERAPVELLSIKGEGIELREGPGKEFSKVINEKTSRILKKKIYATVDYSVRVRIDEEKGDWTKITVMEPSYLSNSHKGWILSEHILSKKEQLIESSRQPKIKIFNDVNDVRNKLSQNGIGILRNWRGDELGWLSSTDYYSFGSNSNKNGMKNNISYSLESKQSNYIRELNITLNVNNKKEYKQAMEKFVNIISKTFKSLDIEVPRGILKKVTNKMSFKGETNELTYQLKLDKSNIDSWTFSLISKME